MYKRGQQLLGASIFLHVLIKLNKRLQQNISSVLVLFNITFRSFPNVFFYFSCSKVTDAIWISGSGYQLRSWYPGLVYLKLLSNVKQRNTPLEECSSEDTHLKQARLDALRGAIWCVKKKPPVKATILSSAIKYASWTIEPRKRDLKILCRIRQGSTWNARKQEVHFNF